jgi:hypothetical protein
VKSIYVAVFLGCVCSTSCQAQHPTMDAASTDGLRIPPSSAGSCENDPQLDARVGRKGFHNFRFTIQDRGVPSRILMLTRDSVPGRTTLHELDFLPSGATQAFHVYMEKTVRISGVVEDIAPHAKRGSQPEVRIMTAEELSKASPLIAWMQKTCDQLR